MIEGRDTTRPFLFSTGGRKVGYVQYWFIADQIAEGWSKEEPWLELVPEDAVGVDISIGPESLLGRGYGSAALRQFCRGLAREGFKTILIDPDEDNLRAVRSYEKAGFRAVDGLKGKAGGCIIMQHAGANEESDA